MPRFFRAGNRISGELQLQMREAVTRLEEKKGQRLGDPADPLLVSVRSGSVDSMPGMMDTILNLGLNDETVKGLAAGTGNDRFAYDCYRRLIQMFGQVVLGIESIRFERLLRRLKRELGVEQDQEVSAEGWLQLIGEYKGCVKAFSGIDFPRTCTSS